MAEPLVLIRFGRLGFLILDGHHRAAPALRAAAAGDRSAIVVGWVLHQDDREQIGARAGSVLPEPVRRWIAGEWSWWRLLREAARAYQHATGKRLGASRSTN